MTTHEVRKVLLPSSGIGTQSQLLFHKYGHTGRGKKVYIQASLHADELPGMLVAHHLIKLLEEADKQNLIAQEILIVPFANPIGLGQNFLGKHQGRFSTASGVNFNRSFADPFQAVVKRVEGRLHETSAEENVRIIREALVAELDERLDPASGVKSVEEVMKLHLLRGACDADLVLDLHCDCNAVMHMYTHDKLWPEMSDLAASLGSKCNIIDADSGGNCFDEAASTPWARLAEKFPSFPIPMACQSTTVELRGEADVFDELALQDATALFHFLQRRGYILSGEGFFCPPPQPDLIRGATPLTGVDMIKAPVSGILAWKVGPGDFVTEGQLLGEVVNMEDPFAARTPIVSRTAGIVFGMRSHKLAVPGDIVIKVSGEKPLAWRTGNLLTN